MCFVINKWQKFEPTPEYLSIINNLTSVTKLHNYLKINSKYIAEKGDYWKTPIEFVNDGGGDCEDFARFNADVLARTVNVEEARFVIHSGYNKKRWGNKKLCHAICVFPYRGELAVFNNTQLRIGFKNYIETGYLTFPDGLKYMEIRDWQGKILQKKFKWFGVF